VNVGICNQPPGEAMGDGFRWRTMGDRRDDTLRLVGDAAHRARMAQAARVRAEMFGRELLPGAPGRVAETVAAGTGLPQVLSLASPTSF
jgi:hypothetical protein